MTQFHQSTWAQRFTKMGDQAEAIYEEVYGEESERFGFNRPCFPLFNVPPALRGAPDYIHGKAPARFVEVQGFSKSLKVKVEKLMALGYWQTLMPVDFFFYSSDRDDHCEISLQDFLKLAGEHATKGTYEDGQKPYLRLTPGVLPWASDSAA